MSRTGNIQRQKVNQWLARTSLVVQTVNVCLQCGRDPGLIPRLGRYSGEGNGNPVQYSCLENSMNKRSLAGYNPRGHKELDMTEHICRDLTGMAESG